MALFLLILLVVSAIGVVGTYWEHLSSHRPARSDLRRRQRLVAGLHEADSEIRREAQKARRAMNTAAGQDWRNRFE